jgi:hypothetical protein
MCSCVQRVFEVEQRHIVSKALIKVWANDEAAAKWAGVSIADFMDAVANKRVLKRCLWTELSEKGLQHGRYRPAVIPPPCRPSRKRAVEVRALPTSAPSSSLPCKQLVPRQPACAASHPACLRAAADRARVLQAAPHANKRKRHNLEVSDTGIFRVHTVKGMEILPRYNRDGYCYVTYEGERLCCARVVAATYLKERLRPGSIVRHRNGDKTDDSVGNLYVKHCYLRKRRAP